MKRFIKFLIKFIIILLIVIFIVVGLLILFRNQIAEYIIEKGGSAVAGAKVEVEGVFLKPFKLHFSWDKLQVTNRNDTWKNLFETGETEFSLAFKPLLAKKILVEKMQLDDLQFGTMRKTDGKLPVKPRREKKPSKLMLAIKENLRREKEKIPVFNPKFLKTKIDVDTLLQVLDFQTPAKADSIKELAQERYAYWDELIKDKQYETDVEIIKSEIKKIKPQEIENLADLQSNFTAASNAYNTTIELYNDFNEVKENLSKDLQMLSQLKEDIPQWIESDYRNAMNLAKLPDVTVQNIALMLFGDKIADGIVKLMEYIEQSRDISKPQTEVPPEKEKMPHLPSFWIKEIILSASTQEQLRLEGLITDISTDQNKTGKPIRINLSGNQPDLGKINLSVLVDHRTAAFKETINLLVDEIPVRDFQLANFDLLPTKLNQGQAMLKSNVNLSDDIIYGEIRFEISNIQFDYNSLPEMDANLIRISRSITDAIEQIDLEAEITQKPEYFKFKLNSNLDNIISQELSNVVSNEIARAKAELEQRVHLELDKYKTEINDLIDVKNGELSQEFDSIDNKIEEQKTVIELKQKEIESRIEAEKNKLQQQAEDKLNEEAEKLLEKLNF